MDTGDELNYLTNIDGRLRLYTAVWGKVALVAPSYLDTYLGS